MVLVLLSRVSRNGTEANAVGGEENILYLQIGRREPEAMAWQPVMLLKAGAHPQFCMDCRRGQDHRHGQDRPGLIHPNQAPNVMADSACDESVVVQPEPGWISEAQEPL